MSENLAARLRELEQTYRQSSNSYERSENLNDLRSELHAYLPAILAALEDAERLARTFERENTELRHDIERHVKIEAELASENAELHTRLKIVRDMASVRKSQRDNWKLRAEEAERKLAEAEQRGADAARREAAEICDGLAEYHEIKNDSKPPDMQSRAEAGSRDCAYAILARIGQKV